jgi:hypothetical protein
MKTITPFREHLDWLRENLPEECANTLPDEGCWKEVAKWLKEVNPPEEVLAPLREAILASGDIDYSCLAYEVHPHADLRKEILAKGDISDVYKAYRAHPHADLRKEILASGDAYCIRWAYYAHPHEDLRKAIEKLENKK